MVGLVGQNPPDLSELSVLKQESEADNTSRLVSPRSCPNESIQDDSGRYNVFRTQFRGASG